MKLLFLLLSLAPLVCLGEQEMRAWTNTQGKSLQATLTQVQGQSVLLKRDNGKEVKIPLSQLSQEDRDYVQEQAGSLPSTPLKGNKTQTGSPTVVLDNYTEKWPEVIRADGDMVADIVSEEDGKYIYETPHFIFHSNAKLNLKVIKSLSKTFEAAFLGNCSLPFAFPCREVLLNPKAEKYNAFLYENKADYTQAGGPENSAGVFIFPNIHVPFDSLGLKKLGPLYTLEGKGDPKTLIHELTHQMSIKKTAYPHWFSEGVAEYVGVSPYKNGILNFKTNKAALVQYVNEYGKDDKGGRALNNEASVKSIKDFFSLPYSVFTSQEKGNFCYGFSVLLFYYFAHIDGKGDGARLIAFAKHLNENPQRKSDNLETFAQAYECLLDGRTWEQLDKEVAQGLRRLKFKLKYEN